MRSVYLFDHPAPPTAEDIAAADEAGAAELISGIPPRLAALGVDSFGFHEIEEEAAAAAPDEVAMWRVRVILAEESLLDDVDAAVAGLSQPIQERWKGAPNFVRNSPLVASLIASLGPSLGLTEEAIDDILVRAAALAE